MNEGTTVLPSRRAQRQAAKWGMGASMAALFYTGFRGGRRAMDLHVWAGVALLGFSLWHLYLYQPRPRAKPQPLGVRVQGEVPGPGR